MENPGLKRHGEVPEPFLRVANRRYASPPPMATPYTDPTEQGYTYNDQLDPLMPHNMDKTVQEDVTKPPPLAGGNPIPPVPLTNGEMGPDRSVNLRQHMAAPAPRQVQVVQQPRVNQSMPNQLALPSAQRTMDTMLQQQKVQQQAQPATALTDPARARRIQEQKQVGGGTMDNPAYERAQQNIRQKMLDRVSHPLHRASIDDVHDTVTDPATGDSVRMPGSWEIVPTDHWSSHGVPNLDYEEPGTYALHSLEWQGEREGWAHHHYPMEGEGEPSTHHHEDLPEAMTCATGQLQAEPGTDAASWSPWMEHQAHHDPTQDMHDLLEIQGTHGNWDVDPYMHGLYNGLELGSAIHDGREPEYRDAPEHWLSAEAAYDDEDEEPPLVIDACPNCGSAEVAARSGEEPHREMGCFNCGHQWNDEDFAPKTYPKWHVETTVGCREYEAPTAQAAWKEHRSFDRSERAGEPGMRVHREEDHPGYRPGAENRYAVRPEGRIWHGTHPTDWQESETFDYVPNKMDLLDRTSSYDDDDEDEEYGLSQDDVDRKVGRDVIPTMEAQGWTTVSHEGKMGMNDLFNPATGREYSGPGYHFEKHGPAGIKSMMTYDFNPVNGDEEDQEPGWHIGSYANPKIDVPGGGMFSRYEQFVNPRDADYYHKQHVLDIGKEMRTPFEHAEEYGFTYRPAEESPANQAYMKRDLGVSQVSRDPKDLFPEGVNHELFQRLNALAYHDVRDDLGRFAPAGHETLQNKPGQFRQAESELGTTKALAWDRLRRAHPHVEIGPDESYTSHYQRLRAERRKGKNNKRPHNKIKQHMANPGLIRFAVQTIVDQGESPLDYTSAWGTKPGDEGHPRRVGLVDPEIGPPVQGDSYFTGRKYRVRRNPNTGRSYRVPREVEDPGAAPGTLSFVDYSRPRPDYLYVNFLNTRQDQQHQGHARRLMEHLVQQHPEVKTVDFGKELSPAVTMMRRSMEEQYPDIHFHGRPYYLMRQATGPLDPVFPYRPHDHPERDTVDPENLQSGDDTYRSEPSLGGRSDSDLLDLVHGPSTGDETPEEERAAEASRGFLDMYRNMPRARRDIRAEDLPPELVDRTEAEDVAGRTNDLLDMALGRIDRPDETGLSQAQKDHIDKYVQGLHESHKEKVQRLHDDWEARGGHATGEPRPVEGFSARYTKPQAIVPMDGNPFPELETPIHYVGKCAGCGTRLYDSEGSSGDPRGALGDHTVSTLDAAEHSPRGVPWDEGRRMHGPSALICPTCENDEHQYNKVLDRFLGHKAGDRTGDGYWGYNPNSGKREFIPSTYGKDRKGKWHEAGEQVGSCPECDREAEL